MLTGSVIESFDGTPLSCWREGTGPSLVLVHGGLCDHMAWHFVIPLLAEMFTVWTYDRRGHGRSGDTQPYAVEREVEDILAVLQAIGEPVHLVGHSAGAILALSAARQADSLRSLMLYEPPFLGPGVRPHPAPQLLTQIQELLEAGRPDDALRIAMKETSGMTDSELDALEASPGWEHLREAAAAIPHDWAIWHSELNADALRDLRVPTLLVRGSVSPEWIRAGALTVLDAIRGAQSIELAGQGHSAMITAPELFAGAVERFAASATLGPGCRSQYSAIT